MFRLTNVVKRRVLLALILSLLFVVAWPVAAENIYIDYTCTLKEAIKAANRDEERQDCEEGSDDDTIIFTRNDKPRSGELPTIDEDLVINGRNFTINADSKHPAFKVKDAHLIIRDIKIRFGSGRNGAAFEVRDGKLTLINVVVENCKRGVKQRDSHTTIEGASDICELAADEIVEGTGTTNVSIPPPEVPQTCGQLPANVAVVTATYGLASGVQCTQLDGAGIGLQSIVDAGFISAVNLWGYVDQGVEICFPQLGSLVFIDSAFTPRVVSAIEAYRKGNSSCAHLRRPGSVVLMPGEPPTASVPVAAEPAAGQPAAAQPAASQPVVEGCPIHTTGHLRLRAAPSLDAETLDYIPRGSNLNSPSRTTFWYQVNYRGLTGWIGQKFVRANC